MRARGHNGRGRGGRGFGRDSNQNRSGGDRNPNKSVRSFEGIPILYPPNSRAYDATKNGVQIVKEKLTRYLAKEYGRYGRFIADDVYYVEPAPAPPGRLDPQDQASVIEWKVYETTLIELAKADMKRNSNITIGITGR